jgi:hypothetical protein
MSPPSLLASPLLSCARFLALNIPYSSTSGAMAALTGGASFLFSCLKKNVPGFLLATVVRPPARRLWFALIFLLRMLFVHVWTQPRTSVL